MPRAGKYRRKVIIQQPTLSEPSADTGERLKTFTKLGDAWAEVSELGTREVWRAQQVNPEITTVITIRWRTDITITSAMRIKYGTRILNLAGPPIGDDRQKELVMRCVEQS